MLFAAGFGTRMGTLTEHRPKPLIEVAGTALLDHALMQRGGAGITRTVVNVHYKAQMIRDHLAGQDISISDESGTILETGGGLKKALPLLGAGPAFTMNTDAVWKGSNPLQTLLASWNPDSMDALLLCVDPQRAIGHDSAGDFTLLPDGQITRGPGLIYTGAQIIKAELAADIDDDAFSLNVLWNAIGGRRRLHGVQYDGHWCDVGHPEGIAMAEAMLADHV